MLITGANCHPFNAGVAADWDTVHAWRSLPLGERDKAADPSHHQQVGTCLSAAQGVDSTVRQLLQLRRQLAPLQGVGFGQALLQLSLSTPP